MRRLNLLRVLPICAALLVAGTATATAAPLASTPILVGVGGIVKHYRLTFQAGPQNASVSLTRTVGRSTATDFLGSTTIGIPYSTKGLASAKMTASFGSHGSAKLKFRATGKERRTLPKGCTGKPALGRSGILTGTLKLKLDHSYFHTIIRTRMGGSLLRPGAYSCGGSGGSGGPSSLAMAVTGGFGRLNLNASRFKRSRVLESFGLTTIGRGFSYGHSVIALAPSSYLTATKNLRTVKLRGLGPFAGGTLKLAANGPLLHHSRNEKVVGGNFFVKFDGVGKQRFKKGRAGGASAN